MNQKDFTLVNPLGIPVANFKRLENAFKAAQKIAPTNDKFNLITNEMAEDGDVLLDNGFSIYKKRCDRDQPVGLKKIGTQV